MAKAPLCGSGVWYFAEYCESDAIIRSGKAFIYYDWLHLSALVAHGRIRSLQRFRDSVTPSRTEAEKAATPFAVPSPDLVAWSLLLTFRELGT